MICLKKQYLSYGIACQEIHAYKNYGVENIFKVDEKTVTRWCKDTYELSYSEAYKRYSANGKASLRRAQWKAALNGNTTMLVWLGKQELGQNDKAYHDKNEQQETKEVLVKFIGMNQ